MPPGLTLYYSPGSCSLASHIVLEEAGATFNPVRVLLAADEHKAPAFMALNPKGRVPVLADDGWVLTETPAILRYICERHPQANLWPQDVRASARCVEWLAWIQSSLDVAVSQVSRTARYFDGGDGLNIVASGKRKIKELAAEIDRKLQGRAWTMGDTFSPADAYLLVYWLASHRPTIAIDLKSTCPAWAGHAARLCARPAVQRVFEREGLRLP